METNGNQGDPLEELRFRVALDTTTVCNLRCRQCFHSLYHLRGLPYRQHEMPAALFEKILDELDGHIESLILSCSAEPFTNSDFHRYLAILRRRAPVFEKWIATNGLLLDEPLARDLIESGLDWMVFSIDGARRETYNALRAGGDFDRLMDRIDMVNRLKTEMQSDRPFLRFNVTVSRTNLDDLPLFVDLASEKQIAELTVQHLVPFRGLNLKRETLFYESRRKVREVFDQTRERARQLGVRVGDLQSLPSPLQCFGDLVAGMARRLRGHATGLYCNLVWLTVVFSSRGDVFPCFCWFNEPPMGNIRDHSFREIWASEPYRRLQAEAAGQLPPRRHCMECSHLGRHRWLSRRSFREQELIPYEM
ncbi:hypothetical protein AMJ85_07160 [candidate division BRC1 bacterium SM23_51]|nr:MAG: hypothetical protein AMJ85_07160 [candidate division BRC1 bacterium SM23_51]